MNEYLTKAIQTIAEDNGIPFDADQIDWNRLVAMGYNLVVLEEQAASLLDVDLETVCCGEHTEMEIVVEVNGVQDLHEFLNECFDGACSAYVYPLLY